MNRYCSAGSPSITFESEHDINLQLYFLQVAERHWNDLIYSIKPGQSTDIDQRKKDQIVFILCCLAISVSQLLGQNSFSPDADKVDTPKKLLDDFIITHYVNEERELMLSQSKKFIVYYNAAHHFGLNKNNQQHRIIDRLTIEQLDEFRFLTIKIWDAVIEAKGGMKSIAEFVTFGEFPKEKYS